MCHADLAPGSKVTYAPEKGAESFAGNRGSIRTLPVKYSAGPLTEGWEPAREMVCDGLCASAARAWLATAPTETRSENDKIKALQGIFSPPWIRSNPIRVLLT